MLKNYIKITFRNLARNRATSFINITGLAIGMAAAVLLFAWIHNELSYDQFHTNKDNLYKVWNRTPANTSSTINCWPAMAPPVGLALKQQFPEVKATARVAGPEDKLLDYKGREIVVGELNADKGFLTMFSFPLLKGSQSHALDEAGNVVLTAATAKKIFGAEDPMNKLIKIRGDSYKVTGVMNDLPNNTEFQFDCITPIKGFNKFDNDAWRDHQFLTYVQLQRGTSYEKFNRKIKNFVLDHAPNAGVELFLQPASHWHLYSNFDNGKEAPGLMNTIRSVLYIGCLILLIACINFMNLGTAQSEKRAKEVGVRKVMGASRAALIRQFLGESVLVSFIAGMIAIVLVQISLPAFDLLVGKNIIIDDTDPSFWFAGFGFILVTGLLAGSYPALFLSAFRPVKVLKGVFNDKTLSVNPRKLLVVIQFTTAVILMVSTLVIYRQLQHVQQRDSGYTRTNLVEHRINGDISKNYEVIKNELLSSGAAISVCKTGLKITQNSGNESGFQWGKMTPEQKSIQFSLFATTGNFIKTTGVKLIAGRDIDLSAYPADSAAILINQTAANIIGYEDPIGQIVKTSSTNYKIVGIVKDFIGESPEQRIDPMIIYGSKYWHNNMAFRLNPRNTVAKDIKIAASIFKKYNRDYPFEYHFADEDYSKNFQDMIRAGRLAGIFALLTICISCLGLFGLTAFMAESRLKEIGIRKVLGASIVGVVQLFTMDFLKLVVISIVIATPVAWWLMNKWLQDYAYRINISWWFFVGAGILTLLIALVTVSFQAIKAAMANPVNSLKAE